jgi:hypothetical protein
VGMEAHRRVRWRVSTGVWRLCARPGAHVCTPPSSSHPTPTHNHPLTPHPPTHPPPQIMTGEHKADTGSQIWRHPNLRCARTRRDRALARRAAPDPRRPSGPRPAAPAPPPSTSPRRSALLRSASLARPPFDPRLPPFPFMQARLRRPARVPPPGRAPRHHPGQVLLPQARIPGFWGRIDFCVRVCAAGSVAPRVARVRVRARLLSVSLPPPLFSVRSPLSLRSAGCGRRRVCLAPGALGRLRGRGLASDSVTPTPSLAGAPPRQPPRPPSPCPGAPLGTRFARGVQFGCCGGGVGMGRVVGAPGHREPPCAADQGALEAAQGRVMPWKHVQLLHERASGPADSSTHNPDGPRPDSRLCWPLRLALIARSSPPSAAPAIFFCAAPSGAHRPQPPPPPKARQKPRKTNRNP